MKEKESRGLKSVDATIQALLAEAGHKGEDVLEPTSQEEPPESAQKKRKIKVMEPLYSYEDIQKRDGMLKYLTGVSQEQFNMLLDLVAKVRERIFFFLFQECSSTAAVFAVLPLLKCVPKATQQKERRSSNEGYRKADLEERLVMFLSRTRRKVGYAELGYQYGIGETSAQRYCDEMLDIFAKHVVPHLVFPRPPEQLRGWASERVKEAFPDLMGVLDATNFEMPTPEVFLENRQSYSPHKNMNSNQVLLGKNSPEVLFWSLKTHSL
jgi:hypothetical protein